MEKRETERVALLDMDGTLCDYDAAMRRDMATIGAPGEPLVWYDDAPAHMIARKKLIQDKPGWWANLAPLPIGMMLAEYLSGLDYKLMVLTKGPSTRNHNAWTEKVQWCRRHMPGVPITITEDKGLMYGRILVDDWPAYVLRWLEWRPRGLVLMPAHAWNETFVHSNVLRVALDGSNLSEVRERIALRDARPLADASG